MGEKLHSTPKSYDPVTDYDYDYWRWCYNAVGIVVALAIFVLISWW
jgi:hypothetical protein